MKSHTEMGCRLKIARKSAGMTQVQLAAEVNCCNNYIAMLEQGARKMTWDKAIKLGKALNVNPAYIMCETDEMLGNPLKNAGTKVEIADGILRELTPIEKKQIEYLEDRQEKLAARYVWGLAEIKEQIELVKSGYWLRAIGDCGGCGERT